LGLSSPRLKKPASYYVIKRIILYMPASDAEPEARH